MAVVARQAATAEPADDSANSPDTAELCVMTFNLRYASASPPNAWSARRPAAKALWDRARPDVVGTQEGLYQQIKNLAADQPDFAWIGLGREGGSRGEFMAIFYRRERLTPLEFNHFWLSDTPDVIGSTTWGNSNRRMVTWVKFRDGTSGRDFYLFNTHFDHEVQAAREKSAELLWSRIEALRTRQPVIVTGDFNAPAGRGAVYETLVGPQRLSDTWTAARERGPAIGTFHNYRGPRDGGERIDWILSRGAVAVESSEVVTDKLGEQYPSDHFPVLVRLRM
ncbi:MAG: endonuclease/exonuclease/phosphatase family protein [Pirellulales bacterium]|nr:endonuclease/exonuclease/phosphatase family protein [Pirellulales bacterium]